MKWISYHGFPNLCCVISLSFSFCGIFPSGSRKSKLLADSEFKWYLWQNRRKPPKILPWGVLLLLPSITQCSVVLRTGALQRAITVHSLRGTFKENNFQTLLDTLAFLNTSVCKAAPLFQWFFEDPLAEQHSLWQRIHFCTEVEFLDNETRALEHINEAKLF